MQDTKNLQKKIKVEYPKLIREARARWDIASANYWTQQIEREKERLEQRRINKLKNEKQYKKAH